MSRTQRSLIAAGVALGLVFGLAAGSHLQRDTSAVAAPGNGLIAAEALAQGDAAPLVWAPIQVAQPGESVAVKVQTFGDTQGVTIEIETAGGTEDVHLLPGDGGFWYGRFTADPGMARYRAVTAGQASTYSDWVDLVVVKPIDLVVETATLPVERTWQATIGLPGSGADFELAPVAEGARQLPPSFALSGSDLLVLDQTQASVVRIATGAGTSERISLPRDSVPFDIIATKDGSLAITDPLNHRLLEVSSGVGLPVAPIQAPVFEDRRVPIDSKLTLGAAADVRLETPWSDTIDPTSIRGGARLPIRSGDAPVIAGVHDGTLHVAVGSSYFRVSVPEAKVIDFTDQVVDRSGRLWYVLGVAGLDGQPRCLLVRLDPGQLSATAMNIGFLRGDITRRISRARSGVVVVSQPTDDTLVWTSVN